MGTYNLLREVVFLTLLVKIYQFLINLPNQGKSLIDSKFEHLCTLILLFQNPIFFGSNYHDSQNLKYSCILYI